METIRDPESMQGLAAQVRRSGRRVVLVPTMGNLHQGHLALIRRASEHAQFRVVSIFVNPTQFGPDEDYETYPRTLEDDLKVCAEEGVDCVFAPRVEQMVDRDRPVHVEVEGWGQELCGRTRPGHFRGVATVVAKLFNICLPDAAVFGWKDAQQFLLLRRMAEALKFPVEMIGVDIVREPDGLALSSRNQYLNVEQRATAPALYQGLKRAEESFARGQVKTGEDLARVAREHIERNTQARIDYVEAVSMTDLKPVQTIESGNTLLALAAYFGDTRLIDNVRL